MLASPSSLPPSPCSPALDTKAIQDSNDNRVNQILRCLRVVVKAGAGRKNDGPGFGNGDHVAEMDEVQRCLASDENQCAAFLQEHVCRAGDEVV